MLVWLELLVVMVCIGWCKAWAQDGRACFLLLLQTLPNTSFLLHCPCCAAVWQQQAGTQVFNTQQF